MLRVRVSFNVRGLELGFGVGVRVEALQGKTKNGEGFALLF